MSVTLYKPHKQPAERSLLLSLDLPETLPEAHNRIMHGLSATLLKQTASLSKFDEAWLCRLAGIDRNTYNRRVNSSEQTFSADQSGRIYMLLRVLSAASKLFNGDMRRAAEWLETPAKGLGGKKPSELTATAVGAEAVINLIGQIEHSVIT
ncbi:antitoxin Xre/MbcA/ParS toxin-binding domain-containing protein [Pantoea sp.]|uniref:type II RES/Xre toxin-antitoxin system antitoxin n=1 Tax=Pantoea sp. TaxID=69393 RepID=UPI002898110D|nr:antitoxin Xre/MbcA/ParS toxin-binding domain-containing protein [Pantoea sp.]